MLGQRLRLLQPFEAKQQLAKLRKGWIDARELSIKEDLEALAGPSSDAGEFRRVALHDWLEVYQPLVSRRALDRTKSMIKQAQRLRDRLTASMESLRPLGEDFADCLKVMEACRKALRGLDQGLEACPSVIYPLALVGEPSAPLAECDLQVAKDLGVVGDQGAGVLYEHLTHLRRELALSLSRLGRTAWQEEGDLEALQTQLEAPALQAERTLAHLALTVEYSIDELSRVTSILVALHDEVLERRIAEARRVVLKADMAEKTEILRRLDRKGAPTADAWKVQSVLSDEDVGRLDAVEISKDFEAKFNYDAEGNKKLLESLDALCRMLPDGSTSERDRIRTYLFEPTVTELGLAKEVLTVPTPPWVSEGLPRFRLCGEMFLESIRFPQRVMGPALGFFALFAILGVGNLVRQLMPGGDGPDDTTAMFMLLGLGLILVSALTGLLLFVGGIVAQGRWRKALWALAAGWGLVFLISLVVQAGLATVGDYDPAPTVLIGFIGVLGLFAVGTVASLRTRASQSISAIRQRALAVLDKYEVARRGLLQNRAKAVGEMIRERIQNDAVRQKARALELRQELRAARKASLGRIPIEKKERLAQIQFAVSCLEELKADVVEANQ